MTIASTQWLICLIVGVSIIVRFTSRYRVHAFCCPPEIPLLRPAPGLATEKGQRFTGLEERIVSCALTALCDVENPLLGHDGAAKDFGPQKGATGPGIEKLEGALTKLRDFIFRQTGKDLAAMKHGGAGGGAAAGIHGVLKATLVNGTDYFLEATGFENALAKADLLITGEGRMDEHTSRGKGPWGVALRAKKKNVPVIGLTGQVSPAAEASLRQHFAQLLAIRNGSIEPDKALIRTAQVLQQMAKELGNRLALNV